MYYPELKKLKGHLGQSGDVSLKVLDRYLFQKRSLPSGSAKRILNADIMAGELNINEGEALLLLSLGHKAGILIPEYTFFHPVDNFILESLIDPPKLPKTIVDFRDESTLDSSEYLIRLTFRFIEDVNKVGSSESTAYCF